MYKIFITSEENRYPVIVLLRDGCLMTCYGTKVEIWIIQWSDNLRNELQRVYKEVDIEDVPEIYRELVRNRLSDPFLDIETRRLKVKDE
jgi:hypothetical protein